MSYRPGVWLIAALGWDYLDPKRADPGDRDLTEATVAILDKEAPTDPAAFRAWCSRNDHTRDLLAQMDDAGLVQTREYLAECAQHGGGISVIY